MSNKQLKVLEIGSGYGYESNLLSKKGYDVVGIELSKENVKQAKMRFPHIKFIKMDATKLEFPDNSFDKVYAYDVLEHVDNLQKVLKEVKRVLRKNGEFIINVPAEKSEYWLLKIRPSYFKDIHHVRVFKGNELQQILTKYDFQIKQKRATDFLKHIELYYLFTRVQDSDTQLCIGNRESSLMTKIVYATTILFDPRCLYTPLKYFPLWILTIPIGFLINFIGNKIMPKSMYYVFYKKV